MKVVQPVIASPPIGISRTVQHVRKEVGKEEGGEGARNIFNLILVVHRGIGSGKKSFQVVRRYHQLLSGSSVKVIFPAWYFSHF